MPLSEEEQRILSEIESQLRASDPDLARQVGSTTIYSHALRQLRWGIVGFIAAFALTIFLLTLSVILAFTGFLAMVACAIVVERAASGFSAYVPDLPGCVATGGSAEEAESRIREVITFHLAGLREDGLPAPPACSRVDYVDIAA